MSLTGTPEATFASADLPRCRRFFLDCGLSLRRHPKSLAAAQIAKAASAAAGQP